ncbi:hypothetical protein ACLI08_11840 [Flavobacterium sp. RNTU_13]|uniref:hypothetical protein n=1 Tax=Flavobacterium sp. RNTU_13 TaxID=3375145 RepID=UPI00398780AE
MAKRKVVTILITLLWLFAIPFAFAQNITDFKRVTPSAQYKQLGGYIYCRLTHGVININVAMQREDASEYFMPAMMQFIINGKPVGDIKFAGSEEPFDEFLLYYNDKSGEYYVFQQQYEDLLLYYVVYHISEGGLVFEGEYDHPYEQFIDQRFTDVSIAKKQQGAETIITLTTTKGESLGLNKDTYVSSGTYTYVNQPLLDKHKAFNWQKGFVPMLKNTINFDLNGDGESEMFHIDWAKKEIKYGNTDAQFMLQEKNASRYIRFEGDTLAFSMSEKGKDGKDTYTYYFSISPKYNTATLHKYNLLRYRAYKDAKGKLIVPCNFEQEYFPIFWGHVPTLERFILDEKKDESFGHGWYVRKFTINGLLKLFSGSKYANDFPNRCAPVPDEREIELLSKTYPLTTKNVQQYNDLAYYLLEFDPQDDYRRDRLIYCSLLLLENITEKFPDRVVAWLNLGDVNWARSNKDHDKGEATKAYKKYLELMKAQGKDMNKVPARVYERMAKYKKG